MGQSSSSESSLKSRRSSSISPTNSNNGNNHNNNNSSLAKDFASVVKFVKSNHISEEILLAAAPKTSPQRAFRDYISANKRRKKEANNVISCTTDQ